MRILLLNICWVLLLSACGEEHVALPKPRAYPRVEFPQSLKATLLEIDECPFVMTYPDFFEYRKTSQFFGESVEDLCWFNLHYHPWKADIYFTYHPISKDHSLQKMVDDAFEMANKHTAKAEFISERAIRTDKGNGGIYFELEGPSASAVQFFLTDSTQHFVRGALYFESKSVPDSLAPMVQFMKGEMIQIINSIAWR
jgi:gliding motility-associated lipoprotein GldD